MQLCVSILDQDPSNALAVELHADAERLKLLHERALEDREANNHRGAMRKYEAILETNPLDAGAHAGKATARKEEVEWGQDLAQGHFFGLRLIPLSIYHNPYFREYLSETGAALSYGGSVGGRGSWSGHFIEWGVHVLSTKQHLQPGASVLLGHGFWPRSSLQVWGGLGGSMESFNFDPSVRDDSVLPNYAAMAALGMIYKKRKHLAVDVRVESAVIAQRTGHTRLSLGVWF